LNKSVTEQADALIVQRNKAVEGMVEHLAPSYIGKAVLHLVQSNQTLSVELLTAYIQTKVDDNQSSDLLGWQGALTQLKKAN
jgi:hypothetical protein